jgi:hypothetical protein
VETTQNAADYQLPTLQDIKPTDNLVADHIKQFYSNWTLITSNPWILSIVQGYKIPFVRQPIQWRQRQTKAKSKEDLASIKEAISQLQAKGAVKAVQEETNQFTSTLFIVKQVSKDRPIFNLKNLKCFVQSQTVRKLIQPGDFMMKLDLQDAYFSVPIHNSHKKYLRFVFQGITYEFQCLPFVLSSAPRTFTKLLKPVIVLLRTHGIRIVIYLDDMLILDQSPERLSSIFRSVVNLLQRLGFLIKQEKCSQAPSQCLEFLGSLINSREMTQAVPNDKLQKLQIECKNAIQNLWLTLKELSALLGRMNHCSQVGLAQGPLHYRALQRHYINSVHQNKRLSNKTKVYLTGKSLTDLQWWILHTDHGFKAIFTRIVTKYYTPQVDLFASRLNHQLPLYVSRHPEPGAMEVDAMTLQWNRWTSFIHAPIIMLPRILKRIREDQATCLLIAPNWPGQTWYPLLLEMLVNIPSLLPMTETSLYLPFDRETQHPLWRTMKLAVWPLSGNVVEQEVFHRTFVTSLWPPGEKERKRDMKVLGDFGLAGVSHGINVHFQPL